MSIPGSTSLSQTATFQGCSRKNGRAGQAYTAKLLKNAPSSACARGWNCPRTMEQLMTGDAQTIKT
jgi:hypothetical protein